MSYGSIAGKHVHIYRFGAHNEWCFVRTPPNYSATGEPCNFIICNHGNGWIMDGTEQKANWTGKTQYGVDYSEGFSGGEGDPMYYLYSNPTIEYFLKQGYVVCGAQNYGDGLYGNDDCVNSCVSFYEHMIKHYNVKPRCAMLGASNGFLTTLNTVHILGTQKVGALIGQYPLCNLTYAWKYSHRKGIEEAYNLVNPSEQEFYLIAEKHDPMLADTVIRDGKRYKLFRYPPTLIYWSSTDSVLDQVNGHAVPFINMLQRSGSLVEDVQVDAAGNIADHGHWSHFNPQQMYEWVARWIGVSE